ncbi:MAG TPA: cytochrome c3 family protein [Candidatus Methylomirabilis sp.]|nr:cytochrome c3 family protein [Candidatus Methylomirabilis sp.]
MLFDGVPGAPGEAGSGQPGGLPPTHRVRRDLLQEIEELKRQLRDAQEAAKVQKEAAPAETERPAERAKTWQEAMAILPKDAAGSVDWVQAITSNTIAPRPSPNPKAPDQAVLDMDVDLTSTASKLFSVTYPHSAHTQWLACGNCHPAIFPLGRGAPPTVVTMAKIRAGEQCGFCHGKVAFSVEKECARCHTKIPARADWHPAGEPREPIEQAASWDSAAKLLPVTGGMPDWAKALAEGIIAPRPGVDPKAVDQPAFPLDVELIPADNPLFKVVFPHGTHTRLLSCTTCHPGIFQMAKGSDPITMGKIYAGQYCGVCHGKVAFAVPTGCPRCHPAMAGRP